jgi:hypothetical protein
VLVFEEDRNGLRHTGKIAVAGPGADPAPANHA